MSAHPARGWELGGPHVLIIADPDEARLQLEHWLPLTVRARSVRTAAETEGFGAEVVVLGGDFPLAELNEVRVHPNLFSKPVVLFAPGKEIPAVDWAVLSVWPVTAEHDPVGQLVWHVRRLLTRTRLGDELIPEDRTPIFADRGSLIGSTLSSVPPLA